MLSSLVLTTWMGFGQTAARYLGVYAVPALERWSDGCPDNWNFTRPERQERE